VAARAAGKGVCGEKGRETGQADAAAVGEGEVFKRVL